MSLSSQGTLQDRTQLLSILSRAVTLTNGSSSPCVGDDLRMLRKVRPSFIGRSAYVWITKADDDAHIQRVKHWAERVHKEVDGEIVLQAGIFEAIYPTVETIAIPPEVFEILGEEVETRTFRYADITGSVLRPDQGVAGGPWEGGDVPDLTQPEAMRWFVYRGLRYLQAGYEAIHLGQMQLVCGTDTGWANAKRLCAALRTLAARHARRGWVILDAHGHGMAVDGQLLFDFTSRPMSARGLVDHRPQIALLKRGEAVGGRHPGGWLCEHSPVLVEVDNWCGYSLPPGAPEWQDPVKLSQIGRWGYDEISWLARLEDSPRREFLRYAHRWTRNQGDTWFFQPPLCRLLEKAAFERNGLHVDYYRANDPSEVCPDGFGDEDIIANLWQDQTAAPRPGEVPNPVTPSGVTVPEPVSVLGGLQTYIGGIEGDASCPWSRLIHVGNGVFEATFVLPLAGTFPFAIAVGGSQSDLTKQGGIAGGSPFSVTVKRPGDTVRIRFDYDTRDVQIIAD